MFVVGAAGAGVSGCAVQCSRVDAFSVTRSTKRAELLSLESLSGRVTVSVEPRAHTIQSTPNIDPVTASVSCIGTCQQKCMLNMLAGDKY